MAVDAAVIKATQESLGPFVKKPPLTEKLLGKPFTLTFAKQRYKSLCFKQSYTSLCVKQRHIYIYSGKPPFRFLHDVFSVIIRDTGTLSGNHFQSEWNGGGGGGGGGSGGGV